LSRRKTVTVKNPMQSSRIFICGGRGTGCNRGGGRSPLFPLRLLSPVADRKGILSILYRLIPKTWPIFCATDA